MKYLKMIAPLAFAGLFATTCAGPPVVSTISGGDRGAGSIKVAWEAGAFQREIDHSYARASASRRCKAWGYSGEIEPYEWVSKTCTAPSNYGCLAYFYEQEVQCLGNPN